MDIIDKFEVEFGNPNKLDFFCRVCDNCNKGMNFGWMVGDYCACSEKCAVSILGGQDRFDEEMKIWEDDGDNDNVYFTDWEDLADACSGNDGYYNSKGDLIECSEEQIKEILLTSNYFASWKDFRAWSEVV